MHGVHKQHPGAQDTHYPSSSGICKLQDNIIKHRLVPGTFPQVCLRDQIVPAILQLLALQKQVTLDFKYFIHFLTPTYLNTSIHWVNPGRLPPGGSALASSKYQLGNKYVLMKDLRMHFLNLFLCELYPRQTDTHSTTKSNCKNHFFSNSCLTWAGRGHGQPESAPLPWGGS